MAIHPVAEGAVLLSLVLAMGAGLIWLVKRLRDVDVQDGPVTSELLTNFNDLHSRGGLSDEEYRTIKTKLAAQLQDDMGVSDAGPPAPGGVEETRQGSTTEDDEGQGGL